MGVITIIRKSRDKEKVGARVRNDEWEPEFPKRMRGSGQGVDGNFLRSRFLRGGKMGEP